MQISRLRVKPPRLSRSTHPTYLSMGCFVTFEVILGYWKRNSLVSGRISKLYGNRKFWRFGVSSEVRSAGWNLGTMKRLPVSKFITFALIAVFAVGNTELFTFQTTAFSLRTGEWQNTMLNQPMIACLTRTSEEFGVQILLKVPSNCEFISVCH